MINMAASIQMDECEPNENPQNELNSLIIQFFEMVPIRRVKLESGNISSQNLNVNTQREVLNQTLKSELCKHYPPSLGYRKAFVKKLLHVLEEYGVEICDEIYEVYTDLLQENEGGEEHLCYKTYTVEGPLNYHVTLQESVNIVSFGTTGLCTWQAAQHLSEWIIQNSQLLRQKNVIELGSGLGLTGIVTCKQCQVKSFTFTDLHRQVLQLLANNIHRNLSQAKLVSNKQHSQYTTDDDGGSDETNSSQISNITCSHSENLEEMSGKCSSVDVNNRGDACDIMTSGDLDQTCDRLGKGPDELASGDTEGLLDLCTEHWERHDSFSTYVYKDMPGVQLAHLDWENLDEKLVDHLSEVDIVLAADVVYDTRIIPHLVFTLKKFLYSNLDRKEPTCAYLSSTIRNEDTRDQFLIALSSEGLNYQQIEGPQLQLFHYDKTVPIEILKITAADV